MTDSGHPDGPARVRDDQGPDRTKLLLGGGLAVVLLAVIGASGGWMLAGEPGRPVSTANTPPTPGEETSTVAPSGTPSQRPTGTRTTNPAGLTVPELVGIDFEDARRELRDRKLGWRLVFGTGSDRSVLRTSPEPGTRVQRGVTVTLWVAGSAPAVSVPDLAALDCGDAANDLVDAGLSPRYRAARRGEVTAQDPAAGTLVHWNDLVALTCGAEPAGAPSPNP